METNVIANLFQNINESQFLVGLIVFLIGLLVVRLLLAGVKKLFAKVKTPISADTQRMMLRIIRMVLYIFLFLFTLSSMGVSFTSMFALITLPTLALSLALQGVVSNVAGNMIVNSTRPFTKGDYIKVEDYEGTVMHISLINTHLKTKDGKIVIIPNNKMYTEIVTNLTENGLRRIELKLSASYDASAAQVREALFHSLHRVEHVLNQPAPQVLVDSYGDSNINYVFRIWTKPEYYDDVYYQAMESVQRNFAQFHIPIDYQRVVVEYKKDGKPEVALKKAK